MDTLLTIIRNVYRIGGRQTQQPTAHQFFRFGIPVSKLAGGLVVNHLIEVGKRDHQQRPLANVAAAGFKVMLAPRDWSETVTVIDRNSADGLHKANIKKIVEKDSKDAAAYTSFNIVVVVEGKGKSVWLDNLKLRSE